MKSGASGYYHCHWGLVMLIPGDPGPMHSPSQSRSFSVCLSRARPPGPLGPKGFSHLGVWAQSWWVLHGAMLHTGTSFGVISSLGSGCALTIAARRLRLRNVLAPHPSLTLGKSGVLTRVLYPILSNLPSSTSSSFPPLPGTDGV